MRSPSHSHELRGRRLEFRGGLLKGVGLIRRRDLAYPDGLT
jgi:hypothetical protein